MNIIIILTIILVILIIILIIILIRIKRLLSPGVVIDAADGLLLRLAPLFSPVHWNLNLKDDLIGITLKMV